MRAASASFLACFGVAPGLFLRGLRLALLLDLRVAAVDLGLLGLLAARPLPRRSARPCGSASCALAAVVAVLSRWRDVGVAEVAVTAPTVCVAGSSFAAGT